MAATQQLCVLIDEAEEALKELCNELQNGKLQHELKNGERSFQILAKDFLHKLDMLLEASCDNDELAERYEEAESKISDVRRVLEQLGYKDEHTDEDTPSALGTAIPNLVNNLWNFGNKVFTLYRTADSISRVPDNIEKLKSYLASKTKDEQAAPVASENVNRQSDRVNPSLEQCVSAADSTLIKKFFEAARPAEEK